VPPPDLYARYGLPDGIRDWAAFDRQVAVAVAFWQELKNSRLTYAALVDALMAAHAELERAGRLTPEGFDRSHADARNARLERLASLASGEAGAATHVGPATVARLRDALGGAVSEADVIQALSEAGVTVVDAFPRVPAKPHPKQPSLATYVTQLGVRLSLAVVFSDAELRGFRILGGLRLADGRGLGEAEITKASGKIAATAYSDLARQTRENVLAILKTALRSPGDLEVLLVSEIAEKLRPLARANFPQRGIAAQAHDLGLHEDDAGLIAAAVLAPDTLDSLRQQVAGELAQGRLRRAQQLAAGLPADDPVRDRITAADARVTALARRADTEETRGRPERAAARLADAIRLACDDTSLSERLAALPPPPPEQVSARMDGDHVLVTWNPSRAATGRVQYLVMRGRERAPGLPSEGVAVVLRTERTDVNDAEAPPGAELRYSVFASRGGETWSAPAVAEPVIFTPDVTEVSVATAEESVGASWRPHPGADAVRVVRREDGPPQGPDDGTVTEASLTGFADAGLRRGTAYYYRIVTSYLTADGQRRRSPGVVVKAVPEPVPRPVDVVEITGPAGDHPVFAAIWTPPPYGRVRLVLSDEPLPWPTGACIGPGEAAAIAEIPGVPRRGTDGRDTFELSLPPGRHYVTALTAGHNITVIGPSTEAWRAQPVRGLSAVRIHDEVRLGWIWPDHATDALVRWPGGEHRCSRRVYNDEGGATITIGAAETTIEVCAAYPRRGGQLVSAPARYWVPGRPVAVRYRIRSGGRWRRGQRAVELAAEQATRLPALIVVRATGPYAPGGPDEGQTIAYVEPQDIALGQPVTIKVAVARGPAWVACFVDPEAPETQAGRILLFPPPAQEMKVR
jgi:hypothetical protein